MKQEKNRATWQEIWKKAPQVSLDQTPGYTSWLPRLLGTEKWEPPQRTPKEAWREYEKELYTPLLNYARTHPSPTYAEMFQSCFPGLTESCCFAANEFRILSFEKTVDIRGKIFADIVKKYLPAPAIVELGAGTGKTLLSIRENLPPGPDFIGLEPMPSAREIMKIFSRTMPDVTIGECDLLTSPPWKAFTKKIPEGSIIYTSFTTIFLKGLNCTQYISDILSTSPKAVISFEPFPGLLDNISLHNLLIKKYIDINKYENKLFHAIKTNKNIKIIYIYIQICFLQAHFFHAQLLYGPKNKI